MRITLASDPGTPGWPNEDFAAVAPGAAVLAAITGEPHVPLSKALADAIGDVRARHEDTCDLTSPVTPAATVTAVRSAGHGIDYLALSDSSVAAVLGAIRDHGPAELVRQVRAAEASDPDGRRWPRGKSRDDATIVYWPQG